MSDVKFEFYGVPNRYEDIIQRMTVLYPFRGLAESAADVRRQTQEMLDQWRARIGVLTSAGWQPSLGTRGGHSILYCRNCKPTFAIPKHKTRSCGRRIICPFCYARWTRQVWISVDENFPAPDTIARPLLETDYGRQFRAIMLDLEPAEPERRFNNSFPFHVVERHHYFFRPVLPADNPHELTIEQNLAGLLGNIAAARANLISMVDPVGAFLYTTLEPWKGGREWRIHHRQIFKLLPTQDMPQEITEATNGRVRRYNRPTRKDILKIVGRVCRYPKGLITGDADRTAQLLNVRREINFRGYASFRSFRNTTEYE